MITLPEIKHRIDNHLGSDSIAYQLKACTVAFGHDGVRIDLTATCAGYTVGRSWPLPDQVARDHTIDDMIDKLCEALAKDIRETMQSPAYRFQTGDVSDWMVSIKHEIESQIDSRLAVVDLRNDFAHAGRGAGSRPICRVTASVDLEPGVTRGNIFAPSKPIDITVEAPVERISAATQDDTIRRAFTGAVSEIVSIIKTELVITAGRLERVQLAESDER